MFCFDNFVAGKEGFSWGYDYFWFDFEAGGNLDWAWFASVSVDALDDSFDQVVDAVWGVGEGDHRNDQVAVGHLDVDVGVEEVLLDLVAVGSDFAEQNHKFQWVDVFAIDDLDACIG